MTKPPSNRPGSSGSGPDDSFDAGLEAVDSGDAIVAEAGGENEADAAAANLRMDMLGVASGDEGLDAPKRSIVSSQNLVLFLVLFAASGALFAMRFLGMGPRSALADPNPAFTYNVDKPSSVMATDHRVVLADLSASRISGQVPPEQVQRNPFKMAGTLAPLNTGPAESGPDTAAVDRAAREQAERERKEREAREQKIMRALATLQVNSVMTGSVPAARVNGELVRVGDTIEEVFTVKDIHGRGVVLEVDGKSFTLEVPESMHHTGGKGRPKK
ncbi:MAG: general secretion pathway protein GspB [Phycisphaeraceae bacterium]|nr:general secretion pathway protein GspB [Phycisphaeraceae bacterium]